MDVLASYGAITAKRRELGEPHHLAMLAVLEEHLTAEVTGNVERIMNTLVPDPSYYFYGVPQPNLSGSAAVRAYYQAIFSSGSNQMEIEFSNIIVDDSGIAADGTMKVIVQGESLRQYIEYGLQVPDPTSAYQVDRPLAMILPFRDGLMVGESFYMGDLDSESITAVASA